MTFGPGTLTGTLGPGTLTRTLDLASWDLGP